MNFTFGIITGGTNNGRESLSNIEISDRICNIIESIRSQNIPNYEIIIVGGINNYGEGIRHIEFDESQKKGWITRKKNIIVENAKYDNLVIMHDYIKLEHGWYQGFLEFGDDWDVCMNITNNIKGGRWIDWLSDHGKYHVLIPYDTKDSGMYISGAYWVAKKSFMERYPLDESLSWGQAEDVDWSKRCLGNANYKMNTNSSVRICKVAKIYSVIFHRKSDAIRAFQSTKLIEILKWYNPELGNNFEPWEIDDDERVM